MSEHGSFVTQYIGCRKCLEVAKKYLLGNDKYLCSVQIPSWIPNQMLPIIAGKIGGLGAGDEYVTFAAMYSDFEKELCHELKVAVFAEVGGYEIFTYVPYAEQC